jgi:hypothetical protein
MFFGAVLFIIFFLIVPAAGVTFFAEAVEYFFREFHAVLVQFGFA